MKKQDNWLQRYERALERANKLLVDSKVILPIDLGEVASLGRIHRIYFRPMLVDGALGVLPDGFEVFVCCKSYEQEEFNEIFAAAGDCHLFPHKIVNRTRFTIAHEVAHACFYEYKAGRYQMPFPIENARAKQSLEHACNRLAGVFLLPERLLPLSFKDDALLPDTLSQVATNSLVAYQTLVIRFADLSPNIQPFGIVACVRATNHAVIPTIQSIWKNYAFYREWPDAYSGTPVSTLCDHPDFIVNSGALFEVDHEIVTSIGKKQVWRFATQHTFSRSSGTYFVVGYPITFD